MRLNCMSSKLTAYGFHQKHHEQVHDNRICEVKESNKDNGGVVPTPFVIYITFECFQRDDAIY